jgi:hypothetical protein
MPPPNLEEAGCLLRMLLHRRQWGCCWGGLGDSQKLVLTSCMATRLPWLFDLLVRGVVRLFSQRGASPGLDALWWFDCGERRNTPPLTFTSPLPTTPGRPRQYASASSFSRRVPLDRCLLLIYTHTLGLNASDDGAVTPFDHGEGHGRRLGGCGWYVDGTRKARPRLSLTRCSSLKRQSWPLHQLSIWQHRTSDARRRIRRRRPGGFTSPGP